MTHDIHGRPMESNFLEMIKSPKDLRHLSKIQLRLLAYEIRQSIIKNVASCGGHLAPSLGVVELTIALHYVFDSPKDRIVWDVGHQCYPHKILTGRKDQMSTLRQHKGLSGFPKREESPHDAFNTGHSSTSISAALGIAKARDLKGEQHQVISVIGDGALTGGLAFEGLNNAGSTKTDMIVVLNDNRMSISPNVGSLSKYLRRLVTNPRYVEQRNKIESLLQRLPRIGEKAAEKAFDIEDALRAISTPGMLFREMGFSYYGPIDGHSLDELIGAFLNIRMLHGPKLLHILTKKGKGYSYAEDDGTRFHGISRFNVQNGQSLKCETGRSFTQAFSDALVDEAAKDKHIVAITAAMAHGTGLARFQELYPDRFFDVGIAEGHAVTFAAGLASAGLKPVCAIYSTFLQRAYDQIIHDVCMQDLPVIFAIDRAGLVGEDGPTHHGVFDISYLRHIPNLTVMAPKDEQELHDMLKAALELNKPAAIRYPRGCSIADEQRDPQNIEIGRAQILRKGKDASIIAIGNTVNLAIEAHNILKNRSISASVVNARFIKPLDKDLITSLARKPGKLVIVEENTTEGGFGSAVLELLSKEKITADTKLIGICDRFIEQGTQQILRQSCGLSKEKIAEAVEGLLR